MEEPCWVGDGNGYGDGRSPDTSDDALQSVSWKLGMLRLEEDQGAKPDGLTIGPGLWYRMYR